MILNNLLSQRTEKKFFHGTQRTRSPQATWDAYQPKLKSMGITRIANVTGLDRVGLPVCVAIRPNARALATSQGKGSTLMAAKVSAMMESIETWHCERIDGEICIASYNELLAHDEVIDVDGLGIRNDAIFHKNAPITWFKGFDLVSNSAVWLPHEAVSTNFVHQYGHQSIFLSSSNGLASGNCYIEAINHAIYELIERDALTLWTLTPDASKKPRQVNIDAIDDEDIQRLKRTLDDKGIELGLWDISSDLNVPVYTSTIIENPDSHQWRPIPMFSGHGCHLNPLVAIARAIHEAIQSRLAAISGSRDDLFPTDYVKTNNRDDHKLALNKIRHPKATRQMAVPVYCETQTLEGDFKILQQALQSAGLDSIVVSDISKPEQSIPVVKVVIPGLEPFHTGLYQPGKRAKAFIKELSQ